LGTVRALMKNIQVIDGADNAVYDIFSATDEEFDLLFPRNEDVAFIEDVLAQGAEAEIEKALANMWKRRIPKKEAQGIHGILFFELSKKKQYYPTRKDEEAVNPDGSRLR
jgi:hypothetical protein